MKIRTAKTHEDARAASRIFALSWKSAYRGVLSDGLLDTLPLDRWVPFFDKNLETGSQTLAILSLEGKDVAAASYGKSRDRSEQNFGEITAIYALPEVWGTGVAGRLMDDVLADLLQTGVSGINLWVLEQNPRAQRFYMKYGFEQSEKTARYEIFGESVTTVEFIRRFPKDTDKPD